MQCKENSERSPPAELDASETFPCARLCTLWLTARRPHADARLPSPLTRRPEIWFSKDGRIGSRRPRKKTGRSVSKHPNARKQLSPPTQALSAIANTNHFCPRATSPSEAIWPGSGTMQGPSLTKPAPFDATRASNSAWPRHMLGHEPVGITRIAKETGLYRQTVPVIHVPRTAGAAWRPRAQKKPRQRSRGP